MTYYLIKTAYCGPNMNDIEHHQDSEGYMIIQTAPGTKNMSGEECTSGWLGTTNDWSSHACGEYENIEEARTAAATRGYTVLLDDGYYGIEYGDHGDPDEIEEIYTTRIGAMQPWDVDEWLERGIHELINAGTTDEQIVEIAKQVEHDAETNTDDDRQGVYLYGDVAEYLREQRDEMRDATDDGEN